MPSGEDEKQKKCREECTRHVYTWLFSSTCLGQKQTLISMAINGTLSMANARTKIPTYGCPCLSLPPWCLASWSRVLVRTSNAGAHGHPQQKHKTTVSLERLALSLDVLRIYIRSTYICCKHRVVEDFLVKAQREETVEEARAPTCCSRTSTPATPRRSPAVDPESLQTSRKHTNGRPSQKRAVPIQIKYLPKPCSVTLEQQQRARNRQTGRDHYPVQICYYLRQPL